MNKPFLTKWPFLWKLRLFFGLILLIVILFFVYFKIIPGGRITYDLKWPRGLASGRGFIYNFQPGLRIDATDPTGLKIIADPVYFTLFTPRTFNQATVTIKYIDRLSSSTPIIELGLLKDKISGSYDFQPIKNNIIDHYQSIWQLLSLGGSRFVLEAKKNYSSTAEFLAALNSGQLKDCPAGPAACVVTYNYPLTINYHLPAGTVLHPLSISQPLRGSHQFYVYFPAGAWRLNFSFTDLNQDRGADPIAVNVWSGSKLIASKTIPDNDPIPASGIAENKNMALSGTVPVAGVYKVEIKITDDTVIKQIESSSNKLSFIGKIWPVSGPGNLRLFTDVSIVRIGTANPASLGDIYFGGQKFSLSEAYRQFNWRTGGSGTTGNSEEIDLPKDDIILSNNGVFAFSPDSLFDPSVKSIDANFSASAFSAADVKYIMADYAAPVSAGGENIATAVFDLHGAVRENAYYQFVISVPGLLSPETSGGGTDNASVASGAAVTADNYLEIKEIKIDLSGTTLWQKIWH